MKVELTKEMFCNAMHAIQRYDEFIEKLCNLLNTELYNGEMQKILDHYINTIEQLCCVEISDYDTDISYFIYDCDWGKSWHPGMIIDENGNDIKLQTLDDLWNLIQSRNDLKQLKE